MGIFENINIVTVLNTGISGFSFLMLFVGYRLISAVQEKSLTISPDDFESSEMFRQWRLLVSEQLLNTRYFLLFTSLIFICALAGLIYKAETQSNIKLVITPWEGSSLPSVAIDGEEDIEHAGKPISVTVQSNSHIYIKNEKLNSKLSEALTNIKDLKKQMSAYVAQSVAENKNDNVGL